MKYFLIVLLCTSLCFAERISMEDGWDGYRESDAMTDEITVTLMCRGIGTYGTGFEGTPELNIRFFGKGDDPFIFVDWNANVGRGSQYCLTRVDDNQAVEYSLLVTSDGEKTVFITDTNEDREELFAQLLAGSEFIVRFTPYRQSQLTIRFSLSGITAVAGECGLDVAYYNNLLE